MYEYHKRSKSDRFLRKALYEEYQHKCVYCGDLLFPKNMQVDHILATNASAPQNDVDFEPYLEELRASGFNTEKPDYIENYLPACQGDNCRKNRYSFRTNNLRFFHDFAMRHTGNILKRIDCYEKNILSDTDDFLQKDLSAQNPVLSGKPQIIEINTTNQTFLKYNSFNCSRIEQSNNVQHIYRQDQLFPRKSANDDSHAEQAENYCDFAPNTILYSVGTKLAFFINQNYYKNKHYLWCTTSFFDSNQPPTSDPQTIAKRLLQIIKTKDQHAREIEDNVSGLLRGIEAKQKQSVIDKEEAEMLYGYINCAKKDYKQFYPVLYIIPVSRLHEYERRCKSVDKKDRASDSAKEFIINDLDLNLNECDVIFFENILSDLPY